MVMDLHDKIIGAGVGVGSGGIVAGLTLSEIQSGIAAIGGILAIGFAVLYYFYLFRKVRRETAILNQKNQAGQEVADARIEAARAEADHWRSKAKPPKL